MSPDQWDQLNWMQQLWIGTEGTVAFPIMLVVGGILVAIAHSQSHRPGLIWPTLGLIGSLGAIVGGIAVVYFVATGHGTGSVIFRP